MSIIEQEGFACPRCGAAGRVVRAGRNGVGAQRYRCGACGRYHTATRRQRGYGDDIRTEALALQAQGLSARAIARRLSVNHQTVTNWARSAAEDSAAAAAPPPVAASRTSADQQRRPTIEDVAREADVSVTTVSNYLNGKGRMGEAIRERIQSAIASLHYAPNALVRAIREHRTRLLGVTIVDMKQLDQNLGDSMTAALLAGFYEAAEAAGYHLLIYTAPQETRSADTATATFLGGHIDGLIWGIPNLDEAGLAHVAAAGLPVIALQSRHVPEGVAYVNADNIGAMERLAAHLADRGHRRIAYAGPLLSSNFLDRREGYRRGLAKAGLSYDPALEAAGEELRWSPEAYRRVLERWLALTEPPTAIMVASDGRARWMAEAISRLGMRIPEDIALTGFNDVPDAQSIVGGLTTMRQPFREMGRIAVERLIARIDGAPVADCRLTLPTQLVERHSTEGARL